MLNWTSYYDHRSDSPWPDHRSRRRTGSRPTWLPRMRAFGLIRMSHLSRIFFQYWNNPGAFNQAGLEPTKLHLDRFLAIMSSIVQVAFGFSGIEIVSPHTFPSSNCYRLPNDPCFRSPCKGFGVHLSSGHWLLTHSCERSAASETESPRRNVVRAVRRVFWRIFIFYICGTLIIGMTVPSNDPRLLRPTGTAAQSPYIIAMTRAGIKGVRSRYLPSRITN